MKRLISLLVVVVLTCSFASFADSTMLSSAMFHLQMAKVLDDVDSFVSLMAMYEEKIAAGEKLTQLEYKTYISYIDIVASMLKTSYYEGALGFGYSSLTEATTQVLLIDAVDMALELIYSYEEQYENGDIDYDVFIRNILLDAAMIKSLITTTE